MSRPTTTIQVASALVRTWTRRVPGIKLHADRLIRLHDSLLYTGVDVGEDVLLDEQPASRLVGLRPGGAEPVQQS